MASQADEVVETKETAASLGPLLPCCVTLHRSLNDAKNQFSLLLSSQKFCEFWLRHNRRPFWSFAGLETPSRHYTRHVAKITLLHKAIIQALCKIRPCNDFSPVLHSLIKNESPGYQSPTRWVPLPFPAMRHFPDVCSTSLTSGMEDQFASTPTWLHLPLFLCDLYTIKLRMYFFFIAILSKAIKLTNTVSV